MLVSKKDAQSYLKPTSILPSVFTFALWKFAGSTVGLYGYLCKTFIKTAYLDRLFLNPRI